MIKRTAILLLLTLFNSLLFAENAAVLFFEYGTSKADILFDLGEPKLRIPGNGFHYETYTSVHTLETLQFFFDEEDKLFLTKMDIGIDYGSINMSLSDLKKRVYNHYREGFISFYGEPFKEIDENLIWRFDDSFMTFYLTMNDNFPRYQFIILNRKDAEEAGYGALYN